MEYINAKAARTNLLDDPELCPCSAVAFEANVNCKPDPEYCKYESDLRAISNDIPIVVTDSFNL